MREHESHGTLHMVMGCAHAHVYWHPAGYVECLVCGRSIVALTGACDVQTAVAWLADLDHRYPPGAVSGRDRASENPLGANTKDIQARTIYVYDVYLRFQGRE